MAKLFSEQAAKEAGVAKSTLLQALKIQSYECQKRKKRHWEIETSELFRVVP